MGLFGVSGPPGVGWSWLQVTLTTNAVTGPTKVFDGGPSRSINPWIIGLRFCVAGAVGLALGLLEGGAVKTSGLGCPQAASPNTTPARHATHRRRTTPCLNVTIRG